MTASIPAVLAFDLGAGSGRAIVGWLDRTAEGSVIRIEEVHRFPNEPVLTGGHWYWDVLRLLHEIKQGMRKAVRKGYDIQSFGIDSWGVDYGLVGADGELLGNPYHYRDSRTDGINSKVAALIGKERLYRETGLQGLPFNTLYQLVAAKESGNVALQQAKALLFMPDLLRYLLTGVQQTEYTIASTSQMLHPVGRTWNLELLKELGIPTDCLLPIVQPGSRSGQLSPDIAEELSIPRLQALAVAGHDTACAVAAVPARQTPFAYISCGTWSLLGTELDSPILDAAADQAGFTNEGGLNGTYRFLRNIMGLWLIQECKREWEREGMDYSYSELVQLAEDAEPFRTFIDPDDLRFLPPGGMPERIRGYARETGQPEPATPGEMTRCIMESLALQYRLMLQRMEKLTGISFPVLHMVGGGIQNRMLLQMTASAIHRPVIAGPVEGSALGNIGIQLLALGELDSVEQFREAVGRSHDIETVHPMGSEEWEAAFERYLRVTGQEL